MRAISVVVNPASGKGLGEATAEEIERELAAYGVETTILRVSSEEGPQALAKQAVGQGAERVILCGGDGTVSGGLAGLVGSGVPAALFPLGTGNLLAHNLNLLGTTAGLVQTAVYGIPTPLDLIRLETDRNDVYWSAVMSGVGFDAAIVKGTDSATKKIWGPLAYVISAIRNYRARSFKMWLDTDTDPPRRFRASSITIANAGRLQGGIPLFPDARPDDGLMDMAVVEASALPEWIRVVWNVLRQRVQDEPTVSLFQCRTAKMYFSRPQHFQYDGEPAGRVHSLTVEVFPRTVSVMVPATVENLGGTGTAP